jgi:hypothetical protein
LESIYIINKEILQSFIVFCHEHVAEAEYVATDEQVADVLTKPLARVQFEYFKERLGALQIEVPSKGK